MSKKNFGKAIILASLVTIGLTGVASACCKSTFDRKKPHVNVGTGGQPGRHLNTGITFTATPGHTKTTPLQRSRRHSGTLGIKQNFQPLPSTTRQSELVIMVTPRLVVPTK